jgi:Mrp family chromosome partitioning ATPase
MDAAPHTLPAPGAGEGAGGWSGARPAAAAGLLRAGGRILRERGWLVLLCPVLVLLGTVVYLRLAPPTYTARAQLLIQPASPDDALLATLPVLHQSAAPDLDVQAATSLIVSRAVARRAVKSGHLRLSPTAALGHVSASEVGQTSLVAVRASSGSARLSQRLANAFAQAAAAEATAVMHAAIRAQLPGLRAELARTPVAERYLPSGAGTDLDELLVLLHQPNPTMLVADRATLPSAPARPRRDGALVFGILAGLLIGVAAAVAADALDPRLRREQQLQGTIALPVLARMPREHRRVGRPLLPGELSQISEEAHRALRSRLLARTEHQPGGRVCLISGVGPGVGKSTTAINLAHQLARGGASVILVEADLRRPAFARALGLREFTSVGQVLSAGADPLASTATVSMGGCQFSLLAARPSSAPLAPRLRQGRIEAVIAQARATADFVVVDSPPLDAVADALQFARYADELLLVVRIGRSRLDNLRDAVSSIAHAGAVVTGLVVVGAARDESASYRAYPHAAKAEARIGAPS